MKNLIILGLLVLGLSSCGQSLDKTTFEDDGGEEVTSGTNFNQLEDIRDCLNGDQKACERAVAEGWTDAPIFFSALSNKTTLVINNLMYTKVNSDDDKVTFQRSKRFWNWNGNYHADIRETLEIHEDYSVDVILEWKYHHQTNYERVYTIIQNHAFDTLFELDPNVELEWKSYDSKTIHIELIGNVKVK